MFKLTKQNDKLEKNIIGLKDHIEFLKNSNKILCEEISSIRSEYLKTNKCESCEPLKNEVTSLHETLDKFTKGKDKFDLILANQKAAFNKNGIRYKPNR